MNLQEARNRIPELAGLSDESALNVIHEVYYPTMDKAQLAERLGFKAAPPPAPERSWGEVAQDVGITALKSAIAVPETVVGMADLVSGGRAGKLAEEAGFRPEEAKAILSEGYSDQQKAAFKAVQDAEGIGGTFMAAVENPSVIGHSVLESAAPMLAGGVVARGLMGIGARGVSSAAGGVGPAIPGVMTRAIGSPQTAGLVAGALGEGITMAGGAAEQIRQQTEDGYLTGKQAGLAAATGAAGTVFSVLGGRIAQKFGFGDVDTMLAGAAANPASAKGIVRSTLEAAFSEGFLEELPQSVVEQVLQNEALGRPLDDGVDQAAVLGTLAGGAMGAGANVLSRAGGTTPEPMVKPPSGPMARAAQKAPAPAQAAAPLPMPTPEHAQALLAHANERARMIEEKANGTKDQKITGPDGKPMVVPGRRPEFLTPEEKAEREFLNANGGDAAALAQVYADVTAPPPPPMGQSLTGTSMESLLGGGGMLGGTDPVAARINRGREDEAATAFNIQQIAATQPPRTAGDAFNVIEEAKARGLDFTVAPHPDGGFLVVPRDRVSPEVAAQAESELGATIERMRQADAAPVQRAPRTPRTDGQELNLSTDPVANYLDELRAVNTPAAKAYVREFDAGRITTEDVQQRMAIERGKTPDERLAEAAAEGLKMNPKGDPFKTLMAARLAAKTTPGSVIEVPGGYAIRPQERTLDQAQNTAQPAQEAAADPGAAPEVRSAGVPGVDEPGAVGALNNVQNAPQSSGNPGQVAQGTAQAAQAQAPEGGDAASAGAGAAARDAGAVEAAGVNPADDPDSLDNIDSAEMIRRLNDPVRQAEVMAGIQAAVSAATAPAKKPPYVSKEDGERLFGVDVKRQKAIERVNKGTAYFATAEKAADFIKAGAIKDTHEVVQAKPGRFEVRAKTPAVPAVPAGNPGNSRAFKAGDRVRAGKKTGIVDRMFKDGDEAMVLWDGSGQATAADLASLVRDESGAPAADQPKRETAIARRNRLIAEREAAAALQPEPTKTAPTANTIFTEDAAAAARARLKAKLGRLNSGLDPEMMMDGITLAGYHIEKGARTFAAYAKAMVADLGDGVKPYLKSWYMGVRYDPRAGAFDGMDGAAAVESATLDNLADGAETGEPENGNAAPDQPGPQTLDDLPSPDGGGTARGGKAGASPAGGSEAGGRSDSGSARVRVPAARGGRGGTRRISDPQTRADTGGRPRGSRAGRAGEGVPGADAGPGVTDLFTGGEQTAETASTPNIPAQNFRIEPSLSLGQGGEVAKFNDNVAAIRVIKAIEADRRRATPEEQRILARFVGWGGLANAFPNPETGEFKPEWKKRGEELRELLTPSEHRAASRSTRNAHYTSEVVVSAMWEAVRRMGYRNGLALESSVGSGNFLGLMPQDVAARFIGVEYDSITARLAAALYPQATVLHSGFQDVALPDNAFDLVIGNPPFGSESLRFQYKPELRGVSIHNQFFRASLDALRPGGLQVQVVSSFLMDAQDKSTRMELAKKAKLVAAFRLPSTAFKENARTDVVTDIIILQRRSAAEEADVTDAARWIANPLTAGQLAKEMDEAGRQRYNRLTSKYGKELAWVTTSEVADPLGGDPISVNTYFASNPGNIIGTMDRSGTMRAKGMMNVRLDDPATLGDRLRELVAKLPENIVDTAADVSEKTEQAYKLLGEAMRISVAREEPGHVKFDDDGKLTRVIDREYGEGTVLQRQVITPDSPWSSQLFMGTDGRWYKVDVKMDDQGKPVKVVKDGKATKRNEYVRTIFQNEADIPASMRLGQLDFDRLGQLVNMRDLLKRQLVLETEDAAKSMMEGNRSKLAAAYKAYVEQHGPVNRRANAALVNEMPDGGLVLALESSYEPARSADQAKKSGLPKQDESVKPAPILRERVVPKYEPPTTASSPADALAITLADRGLVDIEHIAKLLGTSPAEAEASLTDGDKPLIFKDPETNTFETANAYLSGQVRRKMMAAKAAGLTKNVQALEAVQPERWGAENVAVQIGASWVPPGVYAEFAEHLMGGRAKVSFSQLTNTFSVNVPSADQAKASQWSTEDLSGAFILGKLLNSQTPTVMHTDSGGKTYVDKEATALAMLKAREMVAEFGDWVFKDGDRRDRLVEIFNEKFNTRVIRQYDGSQLKLPGKVPDAMIKMRRHQMNAIWRGISTRFLLIDHVVGAGKTFTAIARAMERRRMGLARKPTIVVPNHLVEQWQADVYRLYPAAKVLAATKKDFEKKNRRRLLSRVATGDYDIVILPHSSFGFVGIAPETELRYLEEELQTALAAVKEAEEQAEEDGHTGFRKPVGVKEAERLVAKIEGRMAKLREGARDRLLTFEQLGIDDLTIDEAHEFKNLFYSSRLTKVRGMGDKMGSRKAADLYNKVRVLRDNGGAITFMTGTPVSNSVVELYTMMRYLASGELRDLGMEHFDAWRTQFVDASPAFEPNESGRLQEVTRLGRTWSNMRSLMDLYYGFTDAVTNDDIKKWYAEDNNGKEFPIPKVKGGDRQLRKVQPTPAQEAVLKEVIAGFDGLDGIKDIKERNATRLRLMDRARKLSLDVRAANPGSMSKESGGKLEQIANEVKRIYDRWEEDKGTQLIFLDRSVPKSKGDDKIIKQYDDLMARRDKALAEDDDQAFQELNEALEVFDSNEIQELRAAQAGGWTAYRQIKDNLIERGIPAAEIRFVQEANTDEQKQALFDAVNGGKVRVLIGSTPRMGAGTNVQQRLVGLHHADVTWKPSDIEQREGRVIRQGNQLLTKYGPNFEVEILAYATERTVDAKMWSLNATKLRAINGLRKYTGDFTMELEDEESVSMAEMAALASGNPLLLERVMLESEIQGLELQERAHRRKLYGAEDALRRARQVIETYPERIEQMRQQAKELIKPIADLQKSAAARRVTVEGNEYADYKGAMKAALAAVETQQAGNDRARYAIEINGQRVTSKDRIDELIGAALGDAEEFEVEIDGGRFTQRTAAGRAASAIISPKAQGAVKQTVTGDLGGMLGMDLKYQMDPARYNDGKVDLVLWLEKDGKTVVSGSIENHDPFQAFTTASLRDALSGLAVELEGKADIRGADYMERELERSREQLPDLESRVDSPFPKAGDLKVKRDRLKEVVGLLTAPAPAQASDDDATGNEAMFSRATGTPSGITKQSATQIVDAIKARWANAPEVVVVQDMQDPLVPEAVRKVDAQQRSQGAAGEPEGFWYGGKAYIVAGALSTPGDVVRVLFHEVLGHYGLRGTFGDSLAPILRQIASLRRNEIVVKAFEYGLVPKNLNPRATMQEVWAAMSDAQRMQAAEEVLAVMAQTKPEMGYVKRAIAAIRAWLRKNVPGFQDMKLTDNDIIGQFILPARRFVEQGPAAARAGRSGSGALPALSFSMAPQGVLDEIAKLDGLFGVAKSSQKTMEGVIGELAPLWQVKKITNIPGRTQYNITTADGNTARVIVRPFNPYGESIYGYDLDASGEMTGEVVGRPGDNPKDAPDADDVWIDVSLLREGGKDGELIYQAVANFAHNTGKVFVGDPAGLSDQALRRRTEQMLSSALKHGTTRHIAPHPRQVSGDAKLGVPALKWVYGDDIGNVDRMIDVSLKSLENAFPSSKLIGYDSATNQFYRTDTGQRFANRGQLARVVGQSIRSRRENAGGMGGQGEAGWRTVARGALFNDLKAAMAVEPTSRNRGSVLGGLREVGTRLERDGATGQGYPAKERIFYSRRRDGLTPEKGQSQTETEAFKRWYSGEYARQPQGNDAGAAAGKPAAAAAESKRSGPLDAQGRPIVFYHGTRDDITQFDTKHINRKDSGWLGRGIYGISDQEDAATYAGMKRGSAGQQVMPLFFAVTNPYKADLETKRKLSKAPQEYIDAFTEKVKARGHDGVMLKYSDGTIEIVAFRPEQVKSATGNNGNFDPQNPDIRFSRSADAPNDPRALVQDARQAVNDLFRHPGKLSFWHKSVGTQYDLAQRSPAFKKVYDRVQDFLGDVSYHATQAADQAPSILPKLDTWRDIFRSPLTPEDNKAIAAPIFEGTLAWRRDEAGKPVRMSDVEAAAGDLTTEQKAQRLLRGDHVTERTLKMWRGLPVEQYETIIEGKFEREMLAAGIVWTDAELQEIFNLSPKQIELYHEFRNATDKSLSSLAISDMLRFGGKDTAELQAQAMDAEDANVAAVMLRDHLLDLAEQDDDRRELLIDTANKMIEKADKVQGLIERGYAPLSRFGHYSLDVLDADGERVYFGLFESKAEANKMARSMRINFPGAEISQGTMSEEAYKLFAGVSPETLELFGGMLGLESEGSSASDKVFQEYLKLAKGNRSAMKRLIQRKGIAGFSEDAGRVLAGFIYSNARQVASGLHMGAMAEAASVIPNQQGELKDAALKLVDYIKNPVEEAAKFRGLLFAQYLGGSIASAMVNMLQPIQVTIPYLSQFGGARGAALEMKRALGDVLKKTTGDKDLDDALRVAEEQGIVAPQEVHQLMAQAQGQGSLKSGDGTTMGNAKAKASNAVSKVSLAWGKAFGAAEQFNRRLTFIASYRLAKKQGLGNPVAFAEKTIAETQFVYNKGNKGRWARGAVGGTIFTFKQYSISYLELLSRMATAGEPGSPERAAGRKAALMAVGVLLLMGGAGGLPFMEDAEDLIDGFMQRVLGYNFSTKQKRKELLAEVFGEEGARFVESGVSGLPGVPIDVSGRLGLGNLIPGTGLFVKKDDYSRDIVDAVGPAGDLVRRGFTAAGQLLGGDMGKAVETISPVAARNLIKAVDMANMGMYRDDRGRKVIDTEGYEALSKAIGFQPNTVARVQDGVYTSQRMISLNKMTESEIAGDWAQGIFEQDQGKVQAARAALQEWNRKNPESPIRINMAQILKRVRAMRTSKQDRIAATAPKEIRAAVRRELMAEDR